MAPSQLAAWRSPHDRRSFKELLAHYAQPLQQLSKQLESAFASHPKTDPQIHDDIFILRYLLSRNGDSATSAAAIQQALQWRKENLALIQAAAELTKPPALSQESLQMLNCYMAAGIHTPTSYGDLILVIRAACVNFPELVKDLNSVAMYKSYLMEVCHQYCDSESRSRGYFVKLFIVNDMNGFSPNPFRIKKFAGTMGSQSKINEFLYPQLLGMMCVVNAPSIMDFVFKMISPLMSKGFVDKFHVHGALTPDPSRIAAKDLPLPFRGDDAAVMPSFIGGRCQCESGCIGFKVPNTLPPPPKKTPHDLPLAASLTTFVQIRYLQKQREQALIERSANISTASQLVSLAASESKFAGEAVPTTKEQIAREQEPQQSVPVWTPGGEVYLAEPSTPETFRSGLPSPLESEILIQTKADDPVPRRKGFPFCC